MQKFFVLLFLNSWF